MKQMKQVTQKQAVYSAVMRYSKRNKLSGAAKFKVYEQLESDFLAGKVFLKKKKTNLMKLKDRQLLRNYIVGLVSNWIRKDDRLVKFAA